MADEDLIHNPPITPTTPMTSGFDATSDMASHPEGQPEAPFSLAKGGATAGPQQSNQPSPMEIGATSPFNPQSIGTEAIAKQADTISNQFQKAQTMLHDPALTQNQNLIKAATTDLLSQHLSRANDNMTSLAAKTGQTLASPYTPPSAGKQAVAHFLDYLTGGQQDLVNITNSLKSNAGQLGPAELLSVQLKMSGVQQQMEFFSVLLGKAVDNIKTIMSIQN